MHSFKTQFNTGYIDLKNEHEPNLSPSQTSMLVAILSLGTFFGSLLGAPIGDTIGRRLSLIASVGVFCFGGILQVLADALPMMLAGRYVAMRV